MGAVLTLICVVVLVISLPQFPGRDSAGILGVAVFQDQISQRRLRSLESEGLSLRALPGSFSSLNTPNVVRH